MAGNFEPVPVTSQKHDPAWKHCQMYKNGDKVHLKCVYCGKVFKGGGIHRIKEHLACQKGNAATCLRVQPDVKQQMQESLNGVLAKKRKKKKLDGDACSYGIGNGTGDALVSNSCGVNAAVALLPVNDTFEQSSNMFLHSEGVIDNRMDGRKKKGKIRKAPPFSAHPSDMIVSNTAGLALKRVSDHVNKAIGRFFFDAGIPPGAVDSASFRLMIDAIAAQGAEVATPSYHDLRSWILKSSVQEMRNDSDQYIHSWERNGCSVLVEEWITEKDKTLLVFLVHSAEGVIFLRSVDISSFRDSVDAINELLKEVVEEVGIGNVLQVITSVDELYVLAGQRLVETHPTIYYTPCAAHSIELMLEDIQKLDWVDSVLERAKYISRFLYNHSAVLSMMRRYTFGLDLVDPGSTHLETDFLTLNRMVRIRNNLHNMVTSDEWMGSPYSKKADGLELLDCITDSSFWSSCGLVNRLTDPLLCLLRIVSGQKRPAMGYVYAGIYRAKETIKKELINKKDYIEYWNIIDRRWEQLQKHPLHAAGFYLNPKFFYSTEGDFTSRFRSLVYDCIENLVPDQKVQDKTVKETNSYHSAAGDFGRKMAIRARDTLLPSEWWSTYGGCCPNLAHLAIRILSQTCSLIRYKPRHIHLGQLHETKNRLERQRLSELIFVQYNMWLRFQKNKEHDMVDPLSLEYASVVHDWVAEKEFCADDLSNSDLVTVDAPLGNTVLLRPPVDDIEA
ncbi:hypothetical protein Leryth_015084 [Lithospermum erythrorhizon]|nr:hypothetical protein Leryth_015084 [Lithospermum erythrorhizon]